MVFEPEFLDVLEALGRESFDGKVWRHVLGDAPPTRANSGGARWNPPGVAALYTSLERATAIAEGDHLMNVQPIRPKAERRVYEIGVQLQGVIDLRDPAVLESLGVSEDDLSDPDHAACRRVGAAAAWLGAEGILVPSARSTGANLVIFIRAQDEESAFDVVGSEVLKDP